MSDKPLYPPHTLFVTTTSHTQPTTTHTTSTSLRPPHQRVTSRADAPLGVRDARRPNHISEPKIASRARAHTHINTFAAKSFTHCSSPVPAAHAAPPAGSSAVAASTTGALAVAAFNLRAARCWMAALLHQMPLKSVAAHPAPNHGISHAREFISTRAVRCSSSNRHAKPCAAATQWVAGARGRRPDSSGGGRHSFLRARGRPTPRESARRLAAVTATTYVPTLASARTRAIAKVLCRAMPLWIARGWNKLMHALHGNGPPLNPNAPPFVPPPDASVQGYRSGRALVFL